MILLGEDGRIRRIESEQEQRLEVRDAMQPLTVTVEENEHITVTGSIEP